MKLKKSIRVTLKVASNQIEQISKQLSETTGDQSDEMVNVTIKNCISNIRSPLDYLADQIFKENNLQHQNNNGKTYFPLFSEENNDFRSQMGRSLPRLDITNTLLYSKLEQIQFYNNREKRGWMNALNKLDIEYKHIDHVEQHKESDTINTGTKEVPNAFGIGKNARNIVIKNCLVNGKPVNATVDEEGKVHAHNPEVTLQE